MDKIDLRHMRVFLQLVRLGSVSKTAEEADISQQAVSGYLKRLRDIFPSELFLRHSSGLTPTDFALELAARFEQILAELDDVFRALPFDPAKDRREITIIANEYGQLAIIPKLFSAMRRQAPGLRLKVVDFDVKTYENLLSTGVADVLIGFADLIDDGLLKTSLKSEHYTCVVADDSHIPAGIKVVSDLSNYPHVEFSSGSGPLSHALELYLDKKRVRRDIVATLPCYTSLKAFLETNDVVAFVPRAIAATSQLRSIPLSIPVKGFDIVIAWHRRSNGNPLRKWITDVAVTALRDNTSASA